MPRRKHLGALPATARRAVYTAALLTAAAGAQAFTANDCQTTPACNYLFATAPTDSDINTIAGWTGTPTDALDFLNKVSNKQRAGDARFPICGSASAYVLRDGVLACACATAQTDFLDDHRPQFGADCDPLGPGATSGSLVFALVCVLLFQTLLLVQNTQKNN